MRATGSAINKQSTATLPAGYGTYSQPAAADEKAGFSLAAPTSWKATTSGYQTYLKDPSAANVNLLVDLTPHTHMNDMLAEATYIEAQSMPRFQAFQYFHQLRHLLWDANLRERHNKIGREFDGLAAKAVGTSKTIAVEIGIDCQDRAFRQPSLNEIVCVSLHGDYRYDHLANTPSELAELQINPRLP